MAHPKALNDTPDTAQPGQPQTRNPTTPGDLPVLTTMPPVSKHTTDARVPRKRTADLVASRRSEPVEVICLSGNLSGARPVATPVFHQVIDVCR